MLLGAFGPHNLLAVCDDSDPDRTIERVQL